MVWSYSLHFETGLVKSLRLGILPQTDSRQRCTRSIYSQISEFCLFWIGYSCHHICLWEIFNIWQEKAQITPTTVFFFFKEELVVVARAHTIFTDENCITNKLHSYPVIPLITSTWCLLNNLRMFSLSSQAGSDCLSCRTDWNCLEA